MSNPGGTIQSIAGVMDTSKDVFDHKKNLISTIIDKTLNISDIVKFKNTMEEMAKLSLTEEEIQAREQEGKYWYLSASDKALIFSELAVNMSASALTAYSGLKFCMDFGSNIVAGNTVLNSATSLLAETCPYFAAATILINAGEIFQEARETKKMRVEFSQFTMHMERLQAELDKMISAEKISPRVIKKLDFLTPDLVNLRGKETLLKDCKAIKSQYDEIGHINYQDLLQELVKKPLYALIQEQTYCHFHKIKDGKNTLVPLNMVYQQAIELKLDSIEFDKPSDRQLAKDYVLTIQNMHNYNEVKQSFSKVMTQKAFRISLLTMGILAAASLGALSLTFGPAAPVAAAVLTIGIIVLGVVTMVQKSKLAKVDNEFSEARRQIESCYLNNPFFNTEQRSEITPQNTKLVDMTKSLINAITQYNSKFAKDLLELAPHLKEETVTVSNCTQILSDIQKNSNILQGKYSKTGAFRKWGKFQRLFAEDPLIVVINTIRADDLDEANKIIDKFIKDQDKLKQRKEAIMKLRQPGVKVEERQAVLEEFVPNRSLNL